MRISLSLCASLASLVIADTSSPSPSNRLIARDYDTVASVISNVTDAVNGLTAVAQNGTADPATLLLASDRIVQAVKSGTVRVRATGNLTYIDTVHLIAPVHKLSALSNDLPESMAKLKASIQTQRLCEVVRLQVGIINNATTGLITAVNSKVPEAALEISQALSQGITDSLTEIQTDFSDQNCVDGRVETVTSAGSPLAFGSSSVLVSLLFGLVTAWVVL